MARRARNQQLVRQLRLLALLTSGRRTIRQLAFALDVTERTVRRDFEALEEAHLPLTRENYGPGECVWHLLTRQPFGLHYQGSDRTAPKADPIMAQRGAGELRGWLELPPAGGVR
jgi:hypothetical protein